MQNSHIAPRRLSQPSSFTRAFFLYRLSLNSGLRKVRDDLAREIVVGICCTVLLGLYIYVFNDFINVSVASLSSDLRDGFAQGAAVLTLIGTALFCGHRVGKARVGEESLYRFARLSGESPLTVEFFFWLLFVPTFCFFFYSLSFFVALRYLVAWPTGTVITDAAIMFALTLSFAGLHARRLRSRSEADSGVRNTFAGVGSTTSAVPTWFCGKPNDVGSSRVMTMFWWNAGILFLRNGTARFLLACSAFVAMGIMILPEAGAVPAFVAAFAAGYLAAGALAVQLAESLHHSWLEKNSGVSQAEYQRMVQRLCGMIGIGTGLISMVAWGIAHGGFFSADACKLALVAFVPPWLLPHVLYQIDARRPGIQFATVFLLGLILSTAIFAHLGFVLALPFVAYYGRDSQKNRFYRA